MSKCPECGFEIKPGKTRCIWCGARLATDEKAAMVRRVQAYIDDEGHIRLALSNCRECGAEMTFNEEKQRFECAYCGASAIIPEALPPAQEKEKKEERNSDYWDHYPPLEQLPAHAAISQFTRDDVAPKVTAFLEKKRNKRLWIREQTPVFKQIDYRFVPFYSFAALAKTSWSGSSISLESLLLTPDRRNIWGEKKTPIIKKGSKISDYGDYLLQADEFTSPLGAEFSSRLWNETIDAPLLEDHPSPPPGWPRPAIDFRQAEQRVRILIKDIENKLCHSFIRDLFSSFDYTTKLKIRSGYLIYLPVWRVIFQIGNKMHHLTLSGVTGVELFHTHFSE